MQSSLAVTTFLMGLAGGPHCIAMCGAVCAGLQQGQYGTARFWKFQLGRMLGYAGLGALAAISVQSLAWFSEQTRALHPLWTFFHVLVLFWGIMLLIYARQPLWADQLGQGIWVRVRRLTSIKGGVVITGVLWALMPCGLLYSALLVSSLSADMVVGALNMATFALGTSVSLFVGPLLWRKLKTGFQGITEDVGMRIAGLLLSLVAGWAIWMDLTHNVKIWCT